MHTLFADVAAVPFLAYGVIFFVMLFEGDIAMLSAFFFVERGTLEFFPTLAAVILGAAVGEVLWFVAGRYDGHGRIGRGIARLASSLSGFDRYFLARPFLTLFVSKFAYGLHHLVVFRVGTLHGDMRRFARHDIPAALLWITIVASLGYLSGTSFDFVERKLRFAEIALLVAIIVLVGGGRLVARVVRRLW